MGPRPSGSGTRRKRPRPRASVNSGWPQSTQWRGGRLEGGKGTRPSLPPGPDPRDFSAARAAYDDEVLEVLPEEPPPLDDVLLEPLELLPLSLEDEVLGVDALEEEPLEEDELLDEEDEPPSFLVEP